MKKTFVRKKEYGGYLPLELNSGQEFFEKYEESIMRFNSVKASFDYVLKKLNVNTIYLPYYYCPSTTAAIKNMVKEVNFYHIDNSFKPIDVPDNEDSVVLLVDYFGICEDIIDSIYRTFKNAEVIIDRAHSFFSEPIIENHVYNVYSAKKFFGIPDGAYLISKELHPSVEVLSESNGYAQYLLEAYEMGTNYAYQHKMDADQIIAADYKCMSKLSMGLLKNVDYSVVENARRQNFAVLFDKLRTLNDLVITEEAAAYQFPLLIKNIGREVKKKLVSEKIYVSTLWSGEDLINYGNEFELSMKDDCIFLPVDQRYNEEDMHYIAERVMEIVRSLQ